MAGTLSQDLDWLQRGRDLAAQLATLYTATIAWTDEATDRGLPAGLHAECYQREPNVGLDPQWAGAAVAVAQALEATLAAAGQSGGPSGRAVLAAFKSI